MLRFLSVAVLFLFAACSAPDSDVSATASTSASLQASLAVLPGSRTADPSPFAKNVAALMGAPAERVAAEADAFPACAPDEIGELTTQTAAFASEEPFASTKALLSDFTRQLIVHAGQENASCKGLANLWNEYDPFLRTTSDPGIGLAQSDIAAGEALERLAGNDPNKVRNRVLALWDSYDPESDSYELLLLVRLNAWTPAVEKAWDDLDEATRHDAALPTYSDTVPDEEGFAQIIGSDISVYDWLSATKFETFVPDYEPYDSVINVAISGYFGGRPGLEYAAARRSIENAVREMYVGAALGSLFDMMDMNTQTLNTTPPN